MGWKQRNRWKNENISEILENVKTVGIGGHIRPDGDCIGSCMALYLYIRKYFPDIEADVYLEDRKPVFDYIDRMDEVKTEAEEDKVYDLLSPVMSAHWTGLLLLGNISMQQKDSLH